MRSIRKWLPVMALLFCLQLTAGASAPWNGTLVGSPSFVTDSGYGQAISLNGSTQYATLPEPGPMDFVAGNSWTIEGRVCTAIATGSHGMIAQSATNGFVIVGVSSGKAYAIAQGLNGNGAITGGSVISNNQWHWIAFVVTSGTSAALYVDGTRVATAAGTFVAPTTSLAEWLGGYTSASNYWNGQLDDIRVSNIARYSGASYTAPAAPLGTDANTVALYHLEGNALDNSVSNVYMSATPAPLGSGLTGQTVTIQGTGTSWTSGTTFGGSSTGTGFSITGQSINAGTQTGTITVTSGTAGTVTWTDSTDALTATEPVSLLPVTIPVSDANWYFSPQVDKGFSNLAVMNASGSLFRVAVSGTTSATLNLTPGSLSGNNYVEWSVDGGAWQAATINSAAANIIPFFSGLSSGSTHTVYFVDYQVDTAFDVWGTAGGIPTNALQINSLQVDGTGATASLSGTILALKTLKVECQGDSITDGLGTEGSTSAANSNATHAWGYYVAQGLQAEWSNIGWPSQGWVANGVLPSGVNYPVSWNAYNNAHSRSWSSPPDYLIVNQGTNGITTGTLATSGSTGTMRGVLAAQRTALGSACRIIYLVPFGQFARSAILNDLSYYGGGTSPSNGYTSVSLGNTTIYQANTDSNTWVIDLGTAESTGLTNSGGSSLQASDTLHPLAAEQARKGALITAAIKYKESLKVLPLSAQRSRGR